MLNKRACHRFADPHLNMRDTGLLHAEQVGFIVRAVVRIIDHHRVLVLYVYDRVAAEHGDFMPLYTVFQTMDDYVTLARQEDGTLKWHTTCFDRLNGDYWFSSKCAFLSAQDERCITRFLNDDSKRGGLTALLRAQSVIQARRAKERKKCKEQKILDRMSIVGALPRGLNSWIRRSVMPAYFMCDHTSVHKPIEGVCTSCGRSFTLSGTKHNAKAICPHCHRELTVKSCAKFGYIYDRDTVQVVQRTGPQEVVIRIIKAEYSYTKDETRTEVYENARFFIGLSPQGSFYVQSYYLSYADGKPVWRSGVRPRFSNYQYSFAADTCAHVYCANLGKELTDTPWQYCPLSLFYQHFREPMELPCFLWTYLEHPRLEHLIKTGFYSLASDIVYRYDSGKGTLDETQNRTHRILGVAAEDVDFLRELDVGRDELKRFRELGSVKDRQELYTWMKERGVTRDVSNVLEYVTAHRLMRYIDEQTSAGGKTQDTLSEYRDYLEMCDKLDYATTDKSILYPKDLHAAHDNAAKQVRIKADAIMRRNFKAAYNRITGNLDYTSEGMMIVLPSSPEELAAEGSALHHCVGNYADRVAKQECIIVFVRRSDEPDKSFYTAEIRDGRVVQLRGLKNCAPTPEVQAFADTWQRDVLQAAVLPSAA